MKIKRGLALVLAVGLALLLIAGCSPEEESGTTPGGETPDEPIIIRVGHTDTSARSTHVCMEWLAEFMDEKTDGRVVVEVYSDGQLGDDPELCRGLLLGTTQVYYGLCGVLGGIVGTKLDILDLPFLYNSYDEWVEGTFGKGGIEIYNELLEGSGFVNVDFMYNGMMNLCSSKRVYHNHEDMKGFKVRVTDSELNVATLEAMGANPTPMSWGEVYTSVAQGALDGLMHSLGVFNDFKFYEMAPYFTISEHQSSPYTVVMSTEFLESLPDDIYDIWMDGIQQACAKQREMERKLELQYIEDFRDVGATVYELTPEEKTAFYERCGDIYAHQKEVTGGDVFDRFMATAGK